VVLRVCTLVDTATLLVLLLPTVIAMALYLAVMTVFARAVRKRPDRNSIPKVAIDASRVSILKPLAGKDDDLALNLRSFANLDHRDYEILFGVANTNDPALPIARAFVREHPHVRARVVITDPLAAMNPKVAQLIALAREATGEILVISDSNIRVHRGYLTSIVSKLGASVGLVSSLFAGEGESSIGAAIENLQLGSIVAPAVALSHAVSKQPFTVGKSMAMRRRDLDKVGGFEAVSNVLAEDHVLGRLFHDAGFGVDVSFDPIENFNVDCSLSRTIERHTRWAKLRRSICPLAFMIEPFFSPIVIATMMTILAPSRPTLAALGIVTVIETACAFRSLFLLRGRALAWNFLPLEIVRAYVLFYCWLRACMTRRIAWRGNTFILGRDSRVSLPPRERRRLFAW
jgi:ceramide glucosyltransferase